jgi:hypothetical protein
LLQDQRRRQYQDEGTRGSADPAQQQKSGHRIDRAHGRRGDRADQQRGYQPMLTRPWQPRRSGEQRTGQVAQEICRCDQSRLCPRQVQRRDHHRQDRGVDEAADTDGGGHRDHSTDGQRQQTGGPRNRYGNGHRTHPG